MSKDYPIQPPNIEAMREQAVEVLMDHFAKDAMDLEEFEGLLDAVNGCSTAGELRKLLPELAPVESSEPATDMIPARGGAPVVVDADRVRDHGFLISVLGSTNRAGRWIPAGVRSKRAAGRVSRMRPAWGWSDSTMSSLAFTCSS